MVACTSGLVALSGRFKAVTVGREVFVYYPPEAAAPAGPEPPTTAPPPVRPRAFRGHAAPVVALQCHPADGDWLFSASADGAILKWSPLTFEVQARYSVDRPVRQAAVVQRPGTAALHAVLLTEKELLLAALDTKAPVAPQPLFEAQGLAAKWACGLCGHANAAHVVQCGRKGCPGEAPFTLPALSLFAATGQYAAVAHGSHVLLCAPFERAEGGPAAPVWRVRCEQPVTALALDPTSATLAVGEGSGRLALYRWDPLRPGFVDPSRSVHHWHPTPIRVLRYSSDGALLLSAASEGVLATWKPRFNMDRFVLPRLGNIVAVACDEERFQYLISTEPNQLHTVDALSKRVLETRTDLNFSQSETFYDGLTVLPDGRTVAVFGRPNTVTFHNPTLGIAVGALMVQPQNYVCQLEGEEPVSSKVEHVCFSPDGQWMVTFNYTDTQLAADVFAGVLRFWYAAESATERYALNTLVHQPHDGPIVQLAYHDSLDLLATVGRDRRVKLWALRPTEKGKLWACQRTLTNPALRPSAVCFSNDPAGSLVLVANQAHVTLWRSDDLTSPGEGAVLTQPVEDQPLVGVAMLRDGRSVVAHSAAHVFTWDIVHCALTCSVKLPVLCVVPLPKLNVHHSSAAFAVLAADRIVEFTTDSALPCFVSAANVAPGAVRRLGVAQGHGGRAYYVALDHMGGLRSYVPPANSSSVLATSADVAHEAAPPPAGRPKGAARKPKAPPPPAPSAAVLTRTVERCNFLFVGETHTIPALRSMYEAFADNFLVPAQAPA